MTQPTKTFTEASKKFFKLVEHVSNDIVVPKHNLQAAFDEVVNHFNAADADQKKAVTADMSRALRKADKHDLVKPTLTLDA